MVELIRNNLAFRELLKISDNVGLKLTVQDCSSANVSEVYLSQTMMTEHGIWYGDSKVLLGKEGLRTACILLTDPAPKAVADDKIKINSVIRSKLGVSVGDSITILKDENILHGKRVCARPFEECPQDLESVSLFEVYLRPHFKGAFRPVHKGDVLSITRGNKEIKFKITKVEPSPFCIVGPGTIIECEEEVQETEKLKSWKVPTSFVSVPEPKPAITMSNVTRASIDISGSASAQVLLPPSNVSIRQNEKGLLRPRNPRGPGGSGRDGDNRGDRDRGNKCDRNEQDNRPNDRDRHRREPRPRERLSLSSSNTANNSETGSIHGDWQRPFHTYSDGHQLFVGNLPHTVTPDDLRDIFSKFGEVADVIIQNPVREKPGIKVPYFAFVVFEEASSVQAAVALKNHSISIKTEDGKNRRLNVEIKKSKPKRGNFRGNGSSDRFNVNPPDRDIVNSSSIPCGNNTSVGVGSGGGSVRGRNYRESLCNDRQQQIPPQHTQSCNFGGSNHEGGSQNQKQNRGVGESPRRLGAGGWGYGGAGHN